MNIVIITSNCPRHEYLITSLANVLKGHSLHIFQEPKNKKRNFKIKYSNSSSMVEWLSDFDKVEASIFGSSSVISCNRETLIPGELNSQSFVNRIKCIKPDLVVVYGTGLIKRELIDICPEILNLHLGLSPFYRGTATTLWPYVDERPEMNGSTIMRLNEGIDSGDIFEVVLAEHDESKTLNEINVTLNKKALDRYSILISDIAENRKRVCIPQDLSLGKLYLNRDFTTDTLEAIKIYFGSDRYLEFLAHKEERIGELKSTLKTIGISYS